MSQNSKPTKDRTDHSVNTGSQNGKSVISNDLESRITKSGSRNEKKVESRDLKNMTELAKRGLRDYPLL